MHIAINGIWQASCIFLLAMSIVCVYRVGRLFLFSHAGLICTGAYLCMLLSRHVGVALQIAIPVAIMFSAGLGCLIEYLFYRPLRKQKANSMIFILASLGVYVLLQNIISFFFGDESKMLLTGEVQKGFVLLGANVTSVQIITVITSIIVMACLVLLGNFTSLGKSIRAVSNDIYLAMVSGVNSDTIILWSVAIGSGLAGLAGILIALDTGVTPTMGMQPYMLGVVAMIIGGKDSLIGICLGALFLAFAQQYGAYYIGSEWQDMISFIILLILLIFRPQGFSGKVT